MKRLLLFISAIAFYILPSFSQRIQAVEIGQQSPNFVLGNLLNYSKKTSHLSDFRGKLVILDFWETGCSPCIAAMPKMDSLQRQFEGKLQIIAITREDNELISNFINRTKLLKGFTYRFPFETLNYGLEKIFPHVFIPHLVWINGDGKVIAITDDKAVNAEKIKKQLEGEKIEVSEKTDRLIRKVNADDPLSLLKESKPLYYNQNTFRQDSLSYTSFLIPYIENAGSFNRYSSNAPAIMGVNLSPVALFMFAYSLAQEPPSFSFNRVRFEVIDIKKLNPGPIEPNAYKEHYYTYGMVLPQYTAGYNSLNKSQKAELRHKMGYNMSKDLETFFGCKASMQKRSVPCQVFRLIHPEKLHWSSNKKEKMLSPGNMGASYKGTHLSEILSDLGNYFLRSLPYQVEADSDPIIDLQLDVKLTEREDLATELEKYGIRLTVENREMDMLVIADR